MFIAHVKMFLAHVQAVTSAVEYLQARRWIHADLKPANVLGRGNEAKGEVDGGTWFMGTMLTMVALWGPVRASTPSTRTSHARTFLKSNF